MLTWVPSGLQQKLSASSYSIRQNGTSLITHRSLIYWVAMIGEGDLEIISVKSEISRYRVFINPNPIP
jgi:hypothetical protein